MIQPLLERALTKLPTTGRLRVRADGAFYAKRFIAALERRRAQYMIAARLTRPLKHRLAGLRYPQVRRDVWTPEFRQCPQGWEHPARFVVIRRPGPEEPSAQLYLVAMKGYTYQVLVTDLP